MPAKTLYIIDGHAQIYRAYYAPFQALTSPTGEPTRAIHVFVQMLMGLLRDRKPDHLVMAMDTADETVFRVQIDPTYKEQREAMPEDLPSQIDRIVAILQAMRIPILRRQGFEADDIIATLVRRHAGEGLDVYLVSRDKDLDQLLGDHVRMYDPGKDREIDVAAMIAEKGYGPDKAIDAQMLMGDSVDNVRGVEGVGPKKAAQLLEKYGSVDGVLAHVEELTPKMRENVKKFAERKDIVRQLVTLNDDVPIDFDLDVAAVERFDPAAAAPIFAELGMHRTLERIASDDGAQPPSTVNDGAPTSSPPRTRGGAGGVNKSPRSAPGDSLFAEPDVITGAEVATGKYELIDTPEALDDFLTRLAAVPAFAFDTETTGLVAAASNLVGLSFSWQADTGFYIPVRGVGRTLPEKTVIQKLKPIFENAAIKKCGQNLKYDLVVLKTLGVEVRGVDFDSMIASFVLDSSRRSHGLDALSLELLRYRPIATHELIGKGKTQTTFDRIDTRRVCDYAAEDADVAWRLRGALERQLTDPGLQTLFRDLEMPLVEVLAQMEYLGVCIDTDMLAGLSNQMAGRLVELRDQIHAAAGRPFNVDSTRQLAEVLFDERKLPVVRKTKTGRSTDAAVLELLAAQTEDPIPRLVLDYRELAKLKSTYVDALPEMVSPRTGRIHASYHQTGASTGRLSCSDPNLQNIPIRTPLGAQIRRAFVPGRTGDVLLKADYSQIELRVLAHFSRDEALQRAFAEDRDIHAFVAAQIAGVPLEQVTPEQRSSAKTVNFGIIYGQGAFGLARQTGMSVPQAKAFIERYFNRYPRIREFLDRCVAQAKRLGYVQTVLGRRRAIPDITSRNQTLRSAAERLAINSVVQGSAADLIKRAMINIHRRIGERKHPSRMLIQVHDELVFETPGREVEAEAAMIREEMSRAIALDVPIKVDTASGPNWLDVK